MSDGTLDLASIFCSAQHPLLKRLHWNQIVVRKYHSDLGDAWTMKPSEEGNGNKEKRSTAFVTNDKQSERILCRFDLPGIRLVPLFRGNETANILPYKLGELEALLEAGLDHLVDSRNVVPIEFQVNKDALWTRSRRPFRGCFSFLGFLEEYPTNEVDGYADDDEQSVLNYPCHVQMFRAAELVVQGIPGRCACPFPHEAWPPIPFTKTKASTIFLKEDINNRKSSTNIEKETPKRIDWIDVTALPFDDRDQTIFPTDRSVLHMLRNLLGTDQLVSPWVLYSQGNVNSADPDETLQRQAKIQDVVILAIHPQQLQQQSNECLHEFRVSDASPSWALHSIVPSWKAPPDMDHLAPSECALMIYKRLPPRDCLALCHPVTKEPVPAEGGPCLWRSTSNPVKDEKGEYEWEHRLVAPPYMDPHDYYPNAMQILQQHLPEIQAEARQIAHWTAWPEQSHYKASNANGGTPWTVFPLCYCFPANDVSQRKWVPLTTAAVPRTTKILESLGDTLRTALFSRLEAGSILNTHEGWADLANHVVRFHLPLDVPEQGHLCGTWVDGCVMTHLPVGERPPPGTPQFVCFDDSKNHRAFNYADQPRTVLILDFARPARWPSGTAVGAHTDELDDFIQKMSAPR